MNLFGLFQRGISDPIRRRSARTERLQQYARFLRAYQGYSVRGITNTNVVRDWRRVTFNFVQPVVNLSAGWFAAKPIDWDVDGDPAATREAYAIWERSGSDGALLENAICCGIYGDLVGLATQDSDGQAKIEFVDPSITDPTFDGSDYSRLAALEIAYESFATASTGARGAEPTGGSHTPGSVRRSGPAPTPAPSGYGAPAYDAPVIVRRELWGPREMEAYEGDTLVERTGYDRLPAVWIRNSSIKGLPYGISDVEPVLDLVEEYDHLAGKQTRIVDYYASPNIVFSGIGKGAMQPEKSVGTVFHLPAEAKAYFLQWSGNTPDVEAQLTRIRNGIAEISQVPAVAFGTVDSGVSNISGVAIKILYGPLLSKTHRKQANWGPALRYLMWLCLRASGNKSVPLAAVNVRFPNATPVDGQAAIAESSGKIASRLSSRRTEMNNQGIEDPDAELKRIVIEEKMLQLATPAITLATDANTAARTGPHGRFAQEDPHESVAPEPTGGAGGDPRAGNAPEPAQTLGDATGTNDADIVELIARFDTLVALESASVAPEAPGTHERRR